ncbi:MAG: hypothetical protein GX139_12600 [Armatimonadetes bacterium]|jgi:hypothetical protein|nr:hypothetical protein [Armatimonadota bacterium]
MWKLDNNERRLQRFLDRAVTVQLQMPLYFIQSVDMPFALPHEEVGSMVCAIQCLSLGRIDHALGVFEELLLDDACKANPTWRSCVSLWAALCRLYSCDAVYALEYIAQVERDLQSATPPEIGLVKGMAFRSQGRISEAIATLRPLVRKHGPIGPDRRTMALAWLIESEAASGRNVALSQRIRWLRRRDENIYQGSMGILLAALYRLSLCADSPINQQQESILCALDQTATFERPLLTLLIQDVLPRPLAGVEERTSVSEF